MTTTPQPRLHSVSQSDARFEAGAETTDNGNAQPPSGGDSSGRGRSKSRASHPLPTDRVKFDNQVEILRTVALTSGNARRGSTAEAMSAAVGLKGGTGGLVSKFFVSAGWFEATGRGEYTASPGTIAWAQHTAIVPDEQQAAADQMRIEAEGSWFWGAIQPVLAAGHPVKQEVVLLELSKVAATANHREQIELIVRWLEWVGLVSIDEDGKLRLRLRPDAPNTSPADDGDQLDAPSDEHETAPAAKESADSADLSTPQKTTVETEALVSFNLSVRLTADDVERMNEEQRDFVLALAEKLRG